MSADAVALWVLTATLCVALVGTWDVLAGGAHTALLRERAQPAPPRSRRGRAAAQANAWLVHRPAGRRLAVKLVAAGVARINALQFVLLAVVAATVGFAMLTLLFPTVIALLGGLACARGCWWWLERKREKRRAAFVAQLPDLARLLSNGTGAGLSVSSSLAVAVDELDEPAASELRLALGEVRLGASFEAAFEHLAERMPSRDLGVLVGTLIIQQRSGGDLVRALTDMADTLESRKEALREVRTTMTGAVTAAYIVAGLGVASVLLINLLRPGALEKLTSSALGLGVLAVSGTLYTVGLLMVRRVTRIPT
ncbi:MAG: type II secretion system F family protein [Solirubrobacteraceae bacterium MAG38_C4-C5]|nr:type II secretion system F family protein [Candidatus Siliceabacter maunaloa]